MNMSLLRRTAWLAFATSLLLPFQNCSRVQTSGSSSRDPSLSLSQNGGSYDGKPDVYRFYDAQNPCASRDRQGRPLANDVIVLKEDSGGTNRLHLARLACVDTAPTPVSESAVVWNSDSDFSYNGKSFSALNPPANFDIVVPECPGTRTVRANATLLNEISSGTNLSVSPWAAYAGISSSIYGTIASMPSYEIARNNGAFLEYWRRLDQFRSLSLNTEYVYSFVAEPGTVQGVYWNFFRNVSGSSGTTSNPLDDSALIEFNLAAGTSRVVYSQNISNISVKMSRVGNGYLCSVFFTTTSTVNPPDTALGIGPSSLTGTERLGDSIRASNVMLLPVNQLCQ